MDLTKESSTHRIKLEAPGGPDGEPTIHQPSSSSSNTTSQPRSELVRCAMSTIVHLPRSAAQQSDDVQFGRGVERARRFVEHEQRGAPIEGASDAEALALPAAQLRTVLSNRSREPVRKRIDAASEASVAHSVPNPRRSMSSAGNPNATFCATVASSSTMCCGTCDDGGQPKVAVPLVERHAVDFDPSGIGHEHAQNEIRERRLPGAVGTGEPDQRAGRNSERDVADAAVPLGRVAIGHADQPDLAQRPRRPLS